jgi:hypothetical protein
MTSGKHASIDEMKIWANCETIEDCGTSGSTKIFQPVKKFDPVSLTG